MIDVSNRRASDFENRLVSAANQESGFFHLHHGYHTDNAAGRDHLIASLEAGDSFL